MTHFIQEITEKSAHFLSSTAARSVRFIVHARKVARQALATKHKTALLASKH